MNSIDPRITITYRFRNIQDATKETIRDAVTSNISTKLDAYLKSVLGDAADAELNITVSIKKNSRDKYDGSVTFDAPTAAHDYRYEAEDFSTLPDLISHAFVHYKERLASQK